MKTRAMWVIGALAAIEVSLGVLVVFAFGDGKIASESGVLLWVGLLLAGAAGLLARRLGSSGLLAGGIVSSLGIGAMIIIASVTTQTAFAVGGAGPEILRALAFIAGGAIAGWAGGVTWAVRREPHLWT
jgi:hypothetical protein